MRILLRIIIGLFKTIWRVLHFIRECISNLFLIFLALAFAGIWMQIKSVGAPISHGALKIDISGIVVDKPSVKNKLRKIGRHWLGINSDKLQENSLFDIVAAIRQAKNDSKITGIVLDLRNFSGTDQPSLEYIGKALREFRNIGKPIYASSDNYSQAQYYLASYANKIYLSPQGKVDLRGISTNTLYFKSFLNNLKIKSHVFRVGVYKSAVEPFLRDNMSPATREADSHWVYQLWKNYLDVVAENRNITPQQLFPGAKSFLHSLHQVGGDFARYAKENKLVDQLATRAEMDQFFIKQFGWNKKTLNYNAISIYDYPVQSNHSQNGNIAVILATGAIIDGEGSPGVAGSDTISSQIRKAYIDPYIKAIVLRINSPGGSVTASETVRQSLAAARAAGKPVVVSMGGVAASGAYWISTPANYISASPTTITGSIGIFSIINTIENSLDFIGVHADGISTSPLADITNTKVLPPQVQQMVQISIENSYANFIRLVAKARKKTPEQINQIAQGRVWTGIDAKNNGLVDTLSDFDDAIKKAVELAKLEEVRLHWYIDESTIIERILEEIRAVILSWLPTPMLDAINAMKQFPTFLDHFKDPQSGYAICLSCCDIR